MSLTPRSEPAGYGTGGSRLLPCVTWDLPTKPPRTVTAPTVVAAVRSHTTRLIRPGSPPARAHSRRVHGRVKCPFQLMATCYLFCCVSFCVSVRVSVASQALTLAAVHCWLVSPPEVGVQLSRSAWYSDRPWGAWTPRPNRDSAARRGGQALPPVHCRAGQRIYLILHGQVRNTTAVVCSTDCVLTQRLSPVPPWALKVATCSNIGCSEHLLRQQEHEASENRVMCSVLGL
jgi:hypothetical protein